MFSMLLLAVLGRHDGPVAQLSRTLSTFADLTDELGRSATGAVRASTDASAAVRDAFLDVLVGANTLSAEAWRGTELRNVSMRVLAGRADADDPRVLASWLASATARSLTGGDNATHDTLLALSDALVQGLPAVEYSSRVVSAVDDFFSVTLHGTHINGSRYALEVKPSSAHAPSCSWLGAPSSSARRGRACRPCRAT